MKKVQRIIKYFCLSLYGLLSLIPFMLVIMTSFKENRDVLSSPPTLLFDPTLKNYTEALNSDILHAITNSLIIGLSATFIAVLFGVFSSYAMSRFRTRITGFTQALVLSLRLIPPVTLVIPYFIIFSKLGMLDNYFALILMYMTICLPLVVWMIKSFYDETPIELDEASRIDGCSKIQTLWHVLIPSIAPGIFASAALTYIVMWNEFMFALYICGSKTRTMPFQIYKAIGYYRLEWGSMSAVAVIAIIPAIIFIALAQKYIVKGLTMGAVKG